MIINMIQYESYIYLFPITHLDISPKKFIILKFLSSKFSYIEVWFTDHNSKLPETGDKINMNLVIN